MATDFGKRLRAARKSAQLTQAQLAKRVGMSQSNLSELERDAYGSGMTMQLATACGVNPAWLATGDGQMLPQESISTQAPQIAERPAAYSVPPTLSDALPVVLRAVAALSPIRWAGVAAMLGQAVGRPDTCRELADELLPLLTPEDLRSKVPRAA